MLIMNGSVVYLSIDVCFHRYAFLLASHQMSLRQSVCKSSSCKRLFSKLCLGVPGVDHSNKSVNRSQTAEKSLVSKVFWFTSDVCLWDDDEPLFIFFCSVCVYELDQNAAWT